MPSSSGIPYCLPSDGKYDREGGVIIHMMSDKDRNSGVPPQDGYFRIECTPGGRRIVCIPKLIIRLKEATKTVRKSKKKQEEDEILAFLAHEGRCLLTASYGNQPKEQLKKEYELVEVVDNLLNREESEGIRECRNRMRSAGKIENLEHLQIEIDQIKSEEEDEYLVYMDIDPEEACFIKRLFKNRSCIEEWLEASRREIAIAEALLNESLKKSGELFLRAIQKKQALVFKSSSWIVENDLSQYFFHGEYLWTPELQNKLEGNGAFESSLKILTSLCRESYEKRCSYGSGCLQNSVSLTHWKQVDREVNINFREDWKKTYLKRHLESLGFDWILTEHEKKGRPKKNNSAKQKPLTGREANCRPTDPGSKRSRKK